MENFRLKRIRRLKLRSGVYTLINRQYPYICSGRNKCRDIANLPADHWDSGCCRYRARASAIYSRGVLIPELLPLDSAGTKFGKTFCVNTITETAKTLFALIIFSLAWTDIVSPTFMEAWEIFS